MKEAIVEARKGLKKGQCPFGSIIVNKKTGRIIGRGHSTVLKDNCAVSHAEINAIKQASKKLKKWDLKGYIIYSTGEPCPMCFSAIHWSNLDEVYFGVDATYAEKLGFREMDLPIKELKKLSKGRIKVKINSNCIEKECICMMKDWKKKKSKTY